MTKTVDVASSFRADGGVITSYHYRSSNSKGMRKYVTRQGQMDAMATDVILLDHRAIVAHLNKETPATAKTLSQVSADSVKKTTDKYYGGDCFQHPISERSSPYPSVGPSSVGAQAVISKGSDWLFLPGFYNDKLDYSQHLDPHTKLALDSHAAHAWPLRGGQPKKRPKGPTKIRYFSWGGISIRSDEDDTGKMISWMPINPYKPPSCAPPPYSAYAALPEDAPASSSAGDGTNE